MASSAKSSLNRSYFCLEVMMTLDNLVSIGRLQKIAVNRDTVQRLLETAEKNLGEVSLVGMSPETRFDLAYKCILKVAIAGLASQGFRTSQNQLGHHQTAIQCLTWTLGVEGHVVTIIEKLRKQRNISDYSGDPVTEPVATSCTSAASGLLARARVALTAQPTSAGSSASISRG